MKIRNSFVSNSSSASFIINVKETPENFYKLLLSNSAMFSEETIYKKLKDFWEYFSKNKHLCKEDVAKEAKACLSLFDVFHGEICIIPKENLSKIFETYFKVCFHFLDIKENELTIEHTIIMYNDFDSFSEMTKELIYLLTVLKIDFSWKIEDD